MSARRALTLLPERQAELETCAYCPKLCRATCPVGTAEARETVTPWGKMGGTYAVAAELTPATPQYAALAWACTGCFACEEGCNHRNPVSDTLLEARAEYVQRGLAPAASERVRTGNPGRRARIQEKTDRLNAQFGLDARAPTALLLGCVYTDRLPAESEDALRAARALFGPIRLLSGCCGVPLEAAGDRAGAALLRSELLRQMGSVRRTVVVDSGCAYALRDTGAEPLVSAAEAALAARAWQAPLGDEALRYHDSCKLGRGLGEYDAPRALLGRASTRGALEFSYHRERAHCSGGGGLLPVTEPNTAAAIADARVAEHERLGGGTIVSACAQSVRVLRRAGARVLDMTTLLRQLTER
jgi:Fe-S oxidoreductase